MANANVTTEKVKAAARTRWDKLTDDDFDAIKNNVVELATRIQARYGISAEDARRQAQEFMEDASGVAAHAYSRATEALDYAAEKLDRTVKDNAWATVGGALLLGGVIGYLMGQEHRHSRW